MAALANILSNLVALNEPIITPGEVLIYPVEISIKIKPLRKVLKHKSRKYQYHYFKGVYSYSHSIGGYHA